MYLDFLKSEKWQKRLKEQFSDAWYDQATSVHIELRELFFSNAQMAASLLMSKETIIYVIDDSPFWACRINSGRNALGKILTMIKVELQIVVLNEPLNKEKEEVIMECIEPYMFPDREICYFHLKSLGFQESEAALISRDVFF